MVKEHYSVRKRWPFDIFWKNKQKAIQELKHPEQGFAPQGMDGERQLIIDHMERMLATLERRDRVRRFLFVKLVLAWVVAYCLTFGKIPWFLEKAYALIIGIVSAVMSIGAN